MSSMAFLLEQVQNTADKEQSEVVRKILEKYHVTSLVCPYRAYESKLNKLKLQIRKADKYVAYLKNRIEWTTVRLTSRKFSESRQKELLISTHRRFVDEESRTQVRLTNLAEEVRQVQLLFGHCRPCDMCRACLNVFNPRRRQKSWLTK